MKAFLTEFKTFAMKGNVMNLAVGVIIGAAFQGVVSSLTDNILSPIIGLFTGQNFDGLYLAFFGVSLRYGAFITSVLNFLIMAFVVFLLVKLMNRFDHGAPSPSPEAAPIEKKLRTCPFCLTEIPQAAIRCSACTSDMPSA